MYLLECNDLMILRIIYFVKLLIKIVFMVIPVILVIMLTMDFVKNVTASDEKKIKNNTTLFIKRIIYALLLFFVPSIVSLVMNLLPSNLKGVDYKACYQNANQETIKELEKLDNTDIDLKIKGDYTNAYFLTENNTCPKYFTFSTNAKNNKPGCISSIVQSSTNGDVFWYKAPDKKYCAYKWAFSDNINATIKLNTSLKVEDIITNSSGCILSRKSTIQGATIITGSKSDIEQEKVTCDTYKASDGRTYCLFNQNDNDWDKLQAGSGTIGERGCLITAMASIISGFGYHVTPKDFSYTNSVDIIGTFSKYNLKATHTTSRQATIDWLEKGNPVLIHNANQHYRALVDISKDKNKVYLSSVYNWQGVVDDNYGWYNVDYIYNRLGAFSEGYLIEKNN